MKRLNSPTFIVREHPAYSAPFNLSMKLSGGCFNHIYRQFANENIRLRRIVRCGDIIHEKIKI